MSGLGAPAGVAGASFVRNSGVTFLKDAWVVGLEK